MTEQPESDGGLLTGRYQFADPHDGCFVPRAAEHGRRLSILAEAAKWYGLSAAEGTIHINLDTEARSD